MPRKLKIGSKVKLKDAFGEITEVQILSQKGLDAFKKHKPKTVAQFEKITKTRRPKLQDTWGITGLIQHDAKWV